MQDATIKVGGMSCSHCVKAVTDAVGALPGVAGVKVSLEAGTAEVSFDPAAVSLEKIKSEIEDQGYDIL
jgi:copper chaperone